MAEHAGHSENILIQDYFNHFPTEAVQEIAAMPPGDIAALLQAQPAHTRTEIWHHLPADSAAQTLNLMRDELKKQLMNKADPIKAARALIQLPGDQREHLLALLDTSRSRELTALMEFPDNTAGALMDVNLPVLHGDMAVRDVLQRLRKHKTHVTQQLYFTTGDPLRLQQVEIQTLALSEPRTPLFDIAKTAITAVLSTAVLDEIIEEFDKSKLVELPVVDINGELLGVIRHDTLIDAVREDTSADLLTMVGASKEERAFSGIGFVVRKRLPWLQINLLTAFLAASVVGLFESTIAAFTALAVLLPVVAGQSGNTGAQALAVTMRALALREISTSHWWRVARKEINAAVINGVAVSLTTALGVLAWSGSTGLAVVIAIAMVISMVAAGFSGVIIPIILSALGQDPAQSSSIILTTVTDVTGFFTFLGIASLLSGTL